MRLTFESKHKLLLLFLIAILLSAFGQEDNWYSLQCRDGGYQIDFPEKPSYGERNLAFGDGDVVLKYYQYEAWKEGTDKNLHYLVGCTEFPDSVLNSENTEMVPTYLDGVVNGTIRTSKGIQNS